MTDLVALRARIRAPPGTGARASQDLTDALRLAPEEPRLLLVRRLALGTVDATAPRQVVQARAEAVLALARSRAVHAATASAGQEAVWFQSEEEARALLLRLLARGEAPHGWFWRLAVPDWQGAPLAVWLRGWLEAARRDIRREVALASAFAALAAEGVLSAVVPALQVAPPAMAPRFAAAVPVEASARVVTAVPPCPGPVIDMLPAPTARGFLAALGNASGGSWGATWIARAALLGAQQSLAAHPARLAAMARGLADAARISAAAVAVVRSGGEVTRAFPARRPPPRRPDASNGGGPVSWADRAASAAQQAHGPALVRDTGTAEGVPQLPQPPLGMGAPRSRGAGVFLLVGPLVQLGLGPWITSRDAPGFGPALLRDIALRQRIPPDDPVFELLAPPPEAADAAALCAWRVGLDRWLRRRARRRVADLVRRPGRLTLAGDRLTVGFPLGAADLALRRRALDRDQGWLPWLGLALFFSFDEDGA